MPRDHANAQTVPGPVAEISPTAARDPVIVLLLGEFGRKAQACAFVHERQRAAATVQNDNLKT